MPDDALGEYFSCGFAGCLPWILHACAKAMAVAGGGGDTQEALVARLDAAVRGHEPGGV